MKPPATIRLLLVEDDEAHARLVTERLRDDAEIEVVACCESLDAAIARARDPGGDDFDAALLDLGLPDSEGVATVRDFHSAAPRLPIVVLSGLRDVSLAIEAMRHGAQDYVVKTAGDGQLLVRSLRLAIERKRLQDIEQMLVGVVSHDLREPLQTVLLACDLLDAHRAQPPEVVMRARRAAQRATSLVHDLLDATHVRLAGVLPLELSTANISAIIQQVIDDARLLHPQRTIIADLEHTVSLLADGKRIAQVVQNLVGNALQHSPPRSDIRVTMRGHPDSLEIAVHNTGSTIPLPLRMQLFEPLKRASNNKSPEHSIGLGLFIVREIVRAHGGTISVDSTDEHGTTFRVTLPAPAASVS
jgi:signal transduction histidine kinase